MGLLRVPDPAAVSIALRGASLGSIGLCVGLWMRGKTVDQTERGNAERRALFVGLWPPMLWLMADTAAELAPGRTAGFGSRWNGALRVRRP